MFKMIHRFDPGAVYTSFILFFKFLAMLGLRCGTGFSLVAASGGYSSCSVQASHCGGFSCCRAGSLQWLVAE